MSNVAWIVTDKRRGWSSGLCSPFFIIHCALLFIYYSSSQAQTRDQFIGTWIGVHTEWDTDLFCPLPTYLQLDTDSTYHVGMVDGSARERTATWSVDSNNVRLDTVHFTPRLVSIQNELLRIGANYPMVFRRFTDVAIDSARVHQQLSGRVWQSDSLTIYFYDNGQVALENPLTKQRTAHFWRLARFSQSVFLIIQGNQHSPQSDYKPLWQISRLSAREMQAIGCSGRAVSTTNFRYVRNITPADTCRPSGFQTCDNCFARMWHYTMVGSEHRYILYQLFRTHYSPANRPGQSGLIRIQFAVNCQGERGLFELAGFDDDYCPKTFDAQITNQLVSVCRNHVPADIASYITDWPTEKPQDSAISLTFRLKDGQLIDILP
ncbi:hypothetical protein [Spirosoma sp. KNUC1025]|uniref:hypothetical protein n=1 Tax=Spirosoma sp. KNUC1025 TaxID=2894082 RepID=UPI003868B887|nr:hypothetical protein LN737_07355 [Spirosoma sp. KNUC1025]